MDMIMKNIRAHVYAIFSMLMVASFICLVFISPKVAATIFVGLFLLVAGSLIYICFYMMYDEIVSPRKKSNYLD